jgi:hypothetical protein
MKVRMAGTLIIESEYLECTATALPQPVQACPNRGAVRHFLGATEKWDRTTQRRKAVWNGPGVTGGDSFEEERATTSHTLRTTQTVACEPILTAVRQNRNKRAEHDDLFVLQLVARSVSPQWLTP